jgi:peptidoglycan/xylan/chitin deacetylase (PgdA/CDA1 family)
MEGDLKIFIFGSLALMLLSSCSKGFLGNCAESGFALTLDDDNIESWHAQRDLFKEMEAKATFFLANPADYSGARIGMLGELHADGHQMGSHGYHHVEATSYAGKMDHYVTEIIDPSLKILGGWGFEVKSFAYPFGTHSEESDKRLLNEFRFLRYSFGGTDTSETIYYHCDEEERVVNCIWVDNGGSSLETVASLLRQTKRRNKVIILCGHIIGDAEGAYSSPQRSSV